MIQTPKLKVYTLRPKQPKSKTKTIGLISLLLVVALVTSSWLTNNFAKAEIGVFGLGTKTDYSYTGGGYTMYSALLNSDAYIDIIIAGGTTLAVFLSNGSGGYATEATYTIAGGTDGYITTADLDGDTDIDIAVPRIQDNVFVLLNNGNGSFAAGVNYATGDYAYYAASADIDGDTDIDLIVANDNEKTISVLKNNGNGTFAAKVDYVSISYVFKIIMVDMDGDTDKDLVTMGGSPVAMSVFFNNGSGVFENEASYAAGNYDIEAVNLDGDSDQDLVVKSTTAIYVFLNSGNGTFAPRVDYAVTSGSSNLELVDLDEDTDKDLVTTNSAANNINVMLNNGSGAFAGAVTYATGLGPLIVKSADLDGDGDKDLVVTNYTGDSVSTFLNNSSGAFAAKQDFATTNGTYWLEVSDLDGDTYPDVVASNVLASSISVLLNTFEPITAPTLTTSAPTNVLNFTGTLNGSITATGGADATVRGFNYGLTNSYGTTVSESGTFSTGAFSSNLTGLICGATYYYRSFATNTAGTGVSSGTSFTTLPCLGGGLPTGAFQPITPPTQGNFSVEINGGDTTTSSSTVTLYFTPGPDTVSMALSNDASFTNSIIEPLVTDKIWTLSPGSGTKTVYVKFYNSYGQSSAPVSDTIELTSSLIPNPSSLNPNPPSASPPSSTQPSTLNPDPFPRNLGVGSTGDDVLKLQQTLNNHGFTLADSGPGSPNNETSFFGPRTKRAVIRLQEAYKDLILTPLGLTNGTGFVGELTRKFLNAWK